MVPDIIRRCVREPTGAARLRLVKTWFGFRAIAEREFFVDYCQRPIGPPLRTEREWLRASPWHFLGRNFYSER